MSRQLFISCVTGEFEDRDGHYPEFRSALAAYLRRADCVVRVQEDFRQAAELDTVEKLAEYIRDCNAVVHLLGHSHGSVASEQARKAFLNNKTLLARKEFLVDHPELRQQLGDCADLTYTQWEAFLAMHYGVELFIYATDDAAAAQAMHLSRLRTARKFADTFRSDIDLLGKLIGDLRKILPHIPELKQQIANSRFLNHSAEDFLGREAELEFLDYVWQRRINVLSLLAWGGVGKTSLVVQWIQQRFIDREWRDDGVPALWRYFDWSFYDQGTGSLDDDNAKRTGNVGDFFEEALSFFGDPDPKLPGKGKRLAELVRQQHSLLVLDGLEPLQAPPNSYQPGQVLDPDLHELLVALAQLNPGLCLLTSRQAVRDLAGLSGKAAKTKDLNELPKETAVRLLRKMQITGTDRELADACEKFACHALSLTLLGRFLFDAHNGDITRIDRVNLHKADRLTRPERHRTAWHVLEAYDEWLNVAKADPTLLAVLRLVGLFDRPAGADCLQELRTGDIITGLTDAIHNMDRDEWNILLKRLERAHLIRLRQSEKQHGEFDVDAHPLVREYFAEQLRASLPEAFRAAHSRLFDYLCESTETCPDTLPGLQPLYQAVTHGCSAGRHIEAGFELYRPRIQRWEESFSTSKLGAYSANVGALSAFFEGSWDRPASELSEPAQAWLLNEAAVCLRAQGRLSEAVLPLELSLQICERHNEWTEAATRACNLGELNVTLGRLDVAEFHSNRAIMFAKRNQSLSEEMFAHAAAADSLFKRGDYENASTLFGKAEHLQAEINPAHRFLYGVRGFRYIDLVLSPAERSVWWCYLATDLKSNCIPDFRTANTAIGQATRCTESVIEYAQKDGLSPLSIALNHLAQTRALLFSFVLNNDQFKTGGRLSDANELGLRNASNQLAQVFNYLQRVGVSEFRVSTLLTAAMMECIRKKDGILKALEYLDEAQQISNRGPMLLFLADIHLTRARIVCSLKNEFQPASVDVHAELAEARRLIEKHKYFRRKEELEDAVIAILHPEQLPAYLERIHRAEEEKRMQQERELAEETAEFDAAEKERIREANRREKQAAKAAKQKKKNAKQSRKRNR